MVTILAVALVEFNGFTYNMIGSNLYNISLISGYLSLRFDEICELVSDYLNIVMLWNILTVIRYVLDVLAAIECFYFNVLLKSM